MASVGGENERPPFYLLFEFQAGSSKVPAHAGDHGRTVQIETPVVRLQSLDEGARNLSEMR